MDIQPQIGRQRARTEQTRGAIIDSALALYRAQGVENTTTSAVIRQSGLGRTTFYRYFKDADDVLNQAVLRDFDAMIADFEAQRFELADLDVQMVEDIMWFMRQMRGRPALRLLYADNNPQIYERIHTALTACSKATLACCRLNYERAQRQGRLRPGITLEHYAEWSTLVMVSFQTVNFPGAGDENRLRRMVTDFLVPSLIATDPGGPENAI